MTMTYKALQAALKTFRNEGLTQIKLNATKDVLQAEYDRLTVTAETTTETTAETVETTSETPVIEPEINNEIITFHSFRDIIRQRKSLTFRPKKAHGFKPEKRYDQLSQSEWLCDTLAFLDDMCIDEGDYIAA
jgi:hypothetical protein